MTSRSIIIMLGMVHLACSVSVAAQQFVFGGVNTNPVPTGVNLGSFIPSDGIQNGYVPLKLAGAGSSSISPVIVLPPLPPGGGSANNPYEFSYPGSYIPRDTPLHRFNGYVVCDPPPPPGEKAGTGESSGQSPEATGESTHQPTRRPAARSLIKTTTTRSLAAPQYLQPCPIYTINGQIQKDDNYSTTRSR